MGVGRDAGLPWAGLVGVGLEVARWHRSNPPLGTVIPLATLVCVLLVL